ncbi:aldose epimerase family protein [Gilvibacter sp.]|uniref:aldose epimerase family protein n=1 Tax=Gilvibacter sp. TaxID=2729997 RepID=UPI003F49ED9D
MQGTAQHFELKNAQGMRVLLTNVGAALMEIQCSDRDGNVQSLIPGFPKATDYLDADYQSKNLCIGATVGRVAGRISNGGFTLGETYFKVPQNKGMHLHSETCGFQHQVWEVQSHTDESLVFKLKQQAGTCGYPGTVSVTASYTLSETNEITLVYEATTDADTVLNLCNHTYFNLAGGGSVKEHQLFIPSTQFLETMDNMVPTGRLLDTQEHNKDFSTHSRVGDRLGTGLDLAYALEKDHAPLRLYAPETGIEMQVSSNQLAAQVYTPPNFKGLNLRDQKFEDFPAICLEMQGYPDAPNRPEFPSVLLKPNEVYLSETTYSFKLRK